jgi:hypothetical protein
MARKLRVQYPGAVYHVLNRGDRREPTFQADADRALFLATPAAVRHALAPIVSDMQTPIGGEFARRGANGGGAPHFLLHGSG